MTQMLKEEVRERLGNIDQIRDIIFGAQIREYETRFGKLESDISLLQQEMRSHVEQLKVNFSAELKAGFESLEKKLKLYNLNHEEEAADLRLSVDRLNRKFSSCVQSLDEELDSQTKSIREDISHTSSSPLSYHRAPPLVCPSASRRSLFMGRQGENNLLTVNS